ncbi:hypothetical protein JKP88DRAFT_266293 [Tribonema minus]|uniref:Zinc finger HIT domain-containing protein 2 n=1 Tax=Tribonema minus TaxID=303371 RepID=A0A835ZEE4_9STRA|nr:hypothetical protein JKP88DRAFT_266293 [Tribonema minus]
MEAERAGVDPVSARQAQQEVKAMLQRVRGGQGDSAGGPATAEAVAADGQYGDSSSLSDERLLQLMQQAHITEQGVAATADSTGSGELSLEHLSKEERAAFMRAVQSGVLTRYVQVWEPWWESPAKLLVQELPPTTSAAQPQQPAEGTYAVVDTDTTCSRHAAAQLLQAAHISLASDGLRLTSPAASPLLPHLVLDVLCSYAALMRLYNGCWCCDPLQAAADMLQLSAVLSKDARHASVALAMESCHLRQQALTGIAKGNATQLSIRALKDALSLLSTQVVTQTALLDLMALFAAALQEPGAKKKKTLALVAKRLEYFAAWARTGTGYKAIEAERLGIAKELAHAEALGGT